MSSSSPKTSGNYQTNCCYQPSPYGNNVGQYSLMPTSHHHHQQQLVNNNVQSLSPTSLSIVYGNQQQQQQANSANVLQTRYQNEQINDKTSNSLTSVNGQQQSMTNNSALAAASSYRRNFNACAKPPYRY
jgi:hypothetical protein